MQIFDLTEHLTIRNRSEWQGWMRYTSPSNDNSNVVVMR